MTKKENTPIKLTLDDALDENWLKVFYTEVGREVTLARESQRETHNWVIAFAGGIIAAAWALSDTNSFYPTEKSFLLVVLMIPLLFRFFVRSCLEYQIFNRWCALRNALDDYYYTKNIHKELNALAMNSLIEQIRLYYFQWKQPNSLGKMLRDNLILAFAWPFILITGLFIWGLIAQKLNVLLCIVLGITVIFMIIELVIFKKYFSTHAAPRKYKINRKDL